MATRSRYTGRLAQWLGMAQQRRFADVSCRAATRPVPDPILGARCNEWQVLAGPAFADLLAQAAA